MRAYALPVLFDRKAMMVVFPLLFGGFMLFPFAQGQVLKKQAHNSRALCISLRS